MKPECQTSQKHRNEAMQSHEIRQEYTLFRPQVSMNSIGLAMIVIFVIMVLFFAAEFTYVLWHRRRFWKKSAISEDIERSVVSSVMSNNESFFARTPPPPPKELLLYNLCWNAQLPPGTAETNSPFTAPGTPIIPTFSAAAASVPQRLNSRQIVQTSYSSNDSKDRKEFDAKRDMIEDKIEEEFATFSSACSTPFHSSPFSSPPHPSTIITRPLTP